MVVLFLHPKCACLPWLAPAGAATFQQPLQVHEHQSNLPFDAKFVEKVNWALEHFSIPGLAVAVVREETFSKVSNPVPRESVLKHCLHRGLN